MGREFQRIIGWVLLVCGAIGFVYGVLTITWPITIIGAVVAGVGWGLTRTSR